MMVVVTESSNNGFSYLLLYNKLPPKLSDRHCRRFQSGAPLNNMNE